MGGAEIAYGSAYASSRARVIELVTQATDEELEGFAPATPEWRTRDLLAHLSGVPADVISGNLDGVGTAAWADAQVDRRRELTVEAIVDEWTENGPAVEPMLPSFGQVAGQFLTDATTHEHDIRGALGAPGARESDAIAISFGWVGARVGEIRDEAGAGALVVETESGAHVFGTGDLATTCSTTRFEFLRATTGRRSLNQIAAWGWDGDPRTDLLVLPIFTARSEALVE